MEAEDLLAAEVAPAGRTLFIGFGAAAVAGRTDAQVFQTDLRAHRACLAAGVTSSFGPWLLDGSEPFGAVVIKMPRSAERLRMTLAMAGAAVAPGGRVTVVGHNDSGIRAAPRDLKAAFGDAEVAGYRRHCRAVTAAVGALAERARLADFAATWQHDGIEVVSYPGVFAHGRLDAGTALLLRSVPLREGTRVLDLGCGSGVIAAVAARAGCETVACDTDAVALEAARATAGPHGATVVASDLFGDAPGPWDVVVTNPPFHRDGRVALQIARSIIADAPGRLSAGGELWMVVNRFLDHSGALSAGFASFEIAAEDRRYRVWRALRA